MNRELEEIKTPEFVSLQFKTAGLGSRATALILDALILAAADVLLLLLLFLIVRSDVTDAGLPLAIMIIALFLLNWGYFFVCEYFFAGKTIGKRRMGIRVIQDNGHSVTLLSSFIRNLLRIIDMLPAAYFLGMLLIFLNSRHKRLGDITAGTLVVHERKAKRKNKATNLEKEIARRGLSKESLDIQEWDLRSLGTKDWKLIKTYSQRLLQLPPAEQNQRTEQVAAILLPKIGLRMEGKNHQELENLLLLLYLNLQDEFEYEL